MAAFSSAFEQDFDVEDLARLELDEKTQQRSDSSHQRQVEATNVSGQLVLKLGETVDEDIAFVSWRTVRAYPHDFIGHTNRDKASPFFKAITDYQAWDFFYLYNPVNPTHHPRLLVRTEQLKDFLNIINKEQELALKVPRGPASKLFALAFGAGETPRPRYGGTNVLGAPLDFKNLPTVNQADLKAFKRASDVHQKQWKDIWLGMIPLDDVEKQKHAQEKALARKKERDDNLLAVQQLFGFKDPWPAPATIVMNAVFISIDIECLEFAPHSVSEVGVAILDTREVNGVERGLCGQHLWPYIKCHHLRVKEYQHRVNRKYVKGCPNAFDFGSSVFPTMSQLLPTLHSLIQPYLETQRQIVLVGHAVEGDVKTLATLGYHVRSWNNLIMTADSQTLHQAWKASNNGRSLEAVLRDLCMTPKHLHNAGNDALFTLRAVIGVAAEQIEEAKAKAEGVTFCPSLFLDLVVKNR